MKVSEYWSKEGNKVVLEKPEQRISALLENLLNLAETVDIISL